MMKLFPVVLLSVLFLLPSAAPAVEKLPLVWIVSTGGTIAERSEEHTSELQSHSFISYAVFCLKKKKQE